MTKQKIRVGGIILCGGKSSRMGSPKYMLPFGKDVLLQRVIQSVGGAVAPLVVVRGQDQQMPLIPDCVRIVVDEEAHQGPLAGLVMGLRAMEDEVDAVYLTGCDVPLLKAKFIEGVVAKLKDFDIAVPVEDKFFHPLAAVYRTSVLSIAEELLANQILRPRALIESCHAKKIPVDDLRVYDPELESLQNMNTPEEYQRLLSNDQSEQ